MNALFGPELKPWETPVDARLSPSSYAATAVFGIVELAVGTLDGAGVPLTPANVGKLSQLFARIVIKAQVETGSGGGWTASLNTRMRGALRTSLLTLPLSELTNWDDWEVELLDRVLSIARTAAWLYAKTANHRGVS